MEKENPQELQTRQLIDLLSQKSQKEWLEHVANWLEYQSLCGASEWRVDELNTYTSTLKSSLSHQTRSSHSVLKRRQLNSVRTEKKEVSRSSRPVIVNQGTKSEIDSKSAPVAFELNKDKQISKSSPEERSGLQSQKLSGKWGAVSHRIHKGVESRDTFSYLQVPSGPEGMKQIRDFHAQRECSNCLLGRGSIKASVVLVEWHAEPMSFDAFGMLKNMRERVLNLSKDQLFWLPFPRGEDCGSCTQIFRAQLGVLSPKAVLLMGAMPISHLDFANSVPEIGERVFLNHKGKQIPLVRTENPMSILQIRDSNQQNKMKSEVLKHLRQFHSILADLRIVQRLR
ncbi:MAG: hypothetical protein CMK59_13015 [Proteobacteria bacterium]|nr:hypothetical protein [Pseudomonadota bacterium]